MFFQAPFKGLCKKTKTNWVLHCIVSIMQAGAIFSNIQALCRYLSIYKKTIFSSSPLLSLVTSTSEISHQPVHTYTTYIWQRGRQNRKTGNGRKVHEEREEKKKLTPKTMLHLGVQCENRKKTPQHKSTYTINTTCNRGKHIQHWQAAIRSGAICGAGHRPARQRGGTKRSEAVWSGRGVMSVIGEGTRASRCSVLSQG